MMRERERHVRKEQNKKKERKKELAVTEGKEN